MEPRPTMSQFYEHRVWGRARNIRDTLAEERVCGPGTVERAGWAWREWWGKRHACHAPERCRPFTKAHEAADTNDNNLSRVTLPGAQAPTTPRTPATIRIGCCSCRRFSPSRATPSPPSSFLPSAPFLLPRFLAELPKQITREPAQRRSCKDPRKVALSAASIWLFFSFFFQVSIDDLILLPQERERERDGFISYQRIACGRQTKANSRIKGTLKKTTLGYCGPSCTFGKIPIFFFSFLPEVRGKERNLSTRSTRMDRLPSVRSLYRGLLISNDLLG